MRKNKIKKMMPNVLAGCVLFILIVAFVEVSIYKSSYDIHEGQYVLQQENGGAIANIQYISDIRDIEDVRSVTLEGNEGFKDTKDWYLVELYINDYGKEVFEYKNILVKAGKAFYGSYTLDIDDSEAILYENYSDKKPFNEMLQIKGSSCELSLLFTGNSAVLSVARNNETAHYYMEKVGDLPFYNMQIIQTVIVAVGVLVGAVYIAYALKKRKYINLVASIAIIIILFIVCLNYFRGDISGEYIKDTNEEQYIAIQELDDGKYVVARGYKGTPTSVTCIECEYRDDIIYDGEDKYIEQVGVRKIRYINREYKLITDIVIYEYVPFMVIAALVLGCIASTIKVKAIKHKASEQQIEDINAYDKEEREEYHGTYHVETLIYLANNLKGMEAYFGINVEGERIVFTPEQFAFSDQEFDTPKYSISKEKFSLYPGGNLIRAYRIIIFTQEDEKTDFEIVMHNNKTYLLKYMEGMLMMVYQLGRKEA